MTETVTKNKWSVFKGDSGRWIVGRVVVRKGRGRYERYHFPSWDLAIRFALLNQN